MARVASTPDRGPLTRHLRDRLASQGVLVGLVEAPDDGGWDDDPQQEGSSFVDYAVLTPLTASEGEGSLGDSASEWRFPYSIAVYGVTVDQVESQADNVRRIIHETAREVVVLGQDRWKIIDARTNSIGGVDISRQAKPSELSQRDVVMIRISKEK